MDNFNTEFARALELYDLRHEKTEVVRQIEVVGNQLDKLRTRLRDIERKIEYMEGGDESTV